MKNILIDSLYNYENIELGVKVKNPKRYEILEMFNDLKDKNNEGNISEETIKYLFDKLVITTSDSKLNFGSLSSKELAMLVENPRTTDEFNEIIYSVTNIYARIMKTGIREQVHALELEELNLLTLHLNLISTEYIESAQNIERSKINIEKEKAKIEKIRKGKK